MSRPSEGDFQRTTELANAPVRFDRGNPDEAAGGRIRVWYGHGKLFEGGPSGPVYEAVDLLDEKGHILFAHRHQVTNSYIDELQNTLRRVAPAFRAAGWYVRAAVFHPAFSTSGLSWPSAGYVHRKAFGNWDECRAPD